jgi:hypothetical protein
MQILTKQDTKTKDPTSYFLDSQIPDNNRHLYGYQKGSRTAAQVKLGYNNFYIYGAANPWTGRYFSLFTLKRTPTV